MSSTPESRIRALEVEVDHLQEQFTHWQRTWGPTFGDFITAAAELRHAVQRLDELAKVTGHDGRLQKEIDVCAQGIGDLRREVEAWLKGQREREEARWEGFRQSMQGEREARIAAENARAVEAAERRVESERMAKERDDATAQAAIAAQNAEQEKDRGLSKRAQNIGLIVAFLTAILGPVVIEWLR